MASQASIEQRIRNELYTGMPALHPYTSQINGAVADGTTTSITVDDGTAWAAGDILEFDEDGDQAYVTVVATNTLTVIRSWNGTTGAAHADNSVIYKNPRFTLQMIQDKLAEIISSLKSEGVYIHATGSGTVDLTTAWYPLTDTGLIQVLSVYYVGDYDEPQPVEAWRWVDQLPSAGFTAAQGITLPAVGRLASGDTFYYTYRKEIAATTDLLTRQEPIVVHGAAYRLLGSAVGPRTHDPGRRTDRTVQPGQEGRDSIWHYREYRRLVLEEQAQLKAEEGKIIHNFRSRRAQRWTP